MRRNKYPRVGNWVTILNPERVIKVGYLNDHASYRAAIQEFSEDDLAKFLNQFPKIQPDMVPGSSFYRKMIKQLATVVAYATVMADRKHGEQRQIFTAQDDSLAGLILQIDQKKMVQIGMYDTGGDEPPRLSHQKSHCLFGFQHHSIFDSEPVFKDTVCDLWMRAEDCDWVGKPEVKDVP